jgi:Restriction endonuclease
MIPCAKNGGRSTMTLPIPEKPEDMKARIKRQYEQYDKWLDEHMDLLNKFLEVAERKVSMLDDYGDENWDALPKEIETCLLKIAKIDNEIDVVDQFRNSLTNERYEVPDKYAYYRIFLDKWFRHFHDNQKQKRAGDPEFKNFSGTDFEIYLAKVLKENGFEDICGTSATGDQGADLIVKHGSRRIVIQAKCWQGSVGNEAVQEVVAAVGFYHADEGWVITSGTFTPSAKALAQENNVRLIDGHALRNRQLT